MFAELRHNVHVSLCVLARQPACACEATSEIARALFSRLSVALRIQWLSAPTMLALEADVRWALARSGWAAYNHVLVRCRNVSQCVLANKYVWCNVTDCEQLHR